MEDRYLSTILLVAMVTVCYMFGMFLGVIKSDGALLGGFVALVGTIAGYLWGEKSGKVLGYKECEDTLADRQAK
jgi:hypothetical protein